MGGLSGDYARLGEKLAAQIATADSDRQKTAPSKSRVCDGMPPRLFIRILVCYGRRDSKSLLKHRRECKLVLPQKTGGIVLRS
jgi:hypothetical protein